MLFRSNANEERRGVYLNETGTQLIPNPLGTLLERLDIYDNGMKVRYNGSEQKWNFVKDASGYITRLASDDYNIDFTWNTGNMP